MKIKITLPFLLFIVLSTINVKAQDFSNRINSYLENNLKKLNIKQSDINDYIITDQYKTEKVNLSHVYINQTINNVMVYNAMANFTFKNDNIQYVTNSLEYNIKNRFNTTTPSITPQEAILRVSNDLKLIISELPRIKEKKENYTYIYSNAGISEDNIRVKLYLKPQKDSSIKLIWEVNINNMASGNWLNVDVDATNGEILNKKNIVLSCFADDELHFKDLNHATNFKEEFSLLNKEMSMLSGNGSYRVYELPVANPNVGGRTLINNPDDPTASPYGWHDTDGIIGAEYTVTQGNNVVAHSDADGSNSIGFRPDGGATLDFDFTLNLDNQPGSYYNASITNLFYLNNMMHDVWYHYGFDEASGNFQQNNYGNGGLGNDYVIADGQDGSGEDNANFATPPDGSNPRMQMFLWKYPLIQKRVLVNSPTGLAGEYVATKADFGLLMLPTPFAWRTGDLILADDGNTATALDGVGLANVEGCNAYVNPSNYTDKIALIKRGGCNFDVKVQRAQDAGAKGAIVYQRGILPTETAGTDYFTYVNMTGTTGSINIPAQFISKDNAATFIAEMQNGPVNVTMRELNIPKRDGSFAANVVTHEYAHGISTRLTGGPSTASCLNSVEQMGEGWSDWAAFMMTLNASSTATEELNMFDYVGWGLNYREAPYTTDMNVNNYTYSYTNTVGGEPHSIGFVWSSILWDLTWLYIDQYGYDADLYNGTGGNNKIMEVVMLAMKMQPCNPDFITGRDAILAADDQLTGDGTSGSGQNKCLIWQAFARRGVGLTASVGGNESYTTPATCTLAVSESELNNNFVKIYPNPSNGLFNITSLRSFENATVSIVDINGRIVHKETKTIQGTSSIDLSNLKNGVYIINIKGDNINKTEKLIIK